MNRTACDTQDCGCSRILWEEKRSPRRPIDTAPNHKISENKKPDIFKAYAQTSTKSGSTRKTTSKDLEQHLAAIRVAQACKAEVHALGK